MNIVEIYMESENLSAEEVTYFLVGFLESIFSC